MKLGIAKYMIVCIAVLTTASSCKVFYPNLMFKSGQQPEITEKTAQDTMQKPYIISKGDKLELYLFSNKGYKLVDVTTEKRGANQQSQRNQVKYLVQRNGYVKLPIIDSVKITGYSIKQAEIMLQKKYAEYINDPFVKLNVTNRRVFVFIGGESAQVIPIQNENTTLIEVLAQAGGIPDRAKAYKIKIIRGNLNEPILKYIDLSTIQGMEKADLSVQANDIIYVEPVIRIAPELVKEISPWVSLLASAVFIYLTITQRLQLVNGN